MAENSPRASAQGSRRPIVDNSLLGSQSGKIPRISETPHAEKAEMVRSKRVAGDGTSNAKRFAADEAEDGSIG